MKPARAFCIGLPVSLALRSYAALVSDASHFRFAIVPVLVHRLVDPCAAVGRFVQSTDWPAHLKKPERLSLYVGQDRLAASKWIPCGIRREVRHGGRVA